MKKLFSKIENHDVLLSKTGNILLVVCRMLLGAVFVFSGFVKAIDPLGFSSKITEYLEAMGGLVGAMSVFSFWIAVALSALELGVGLCLILKVHVRIASVIALIFMLIMTPLTLWIALKNPVSDCGCFGDALVISNWATFYKNVVLFILVLFPLIFQSRIRSTFTPVTQNLYAIGFLSLSFILSAYCYRHLPLIDFLPYKNGVNIAQEMIIPEGATTDKYETTFIYQRNGVQKEFTLENYPKNDSTWKFVDQKTVLVTEGYKAKIHDFSIVTLDFQDITEQVLYDPGYTYLLIMHNVKGASGTGLRKAERLYQQVVGRGAKFYALTASTDEEIQLLKEKYKLTFPFCKTDPTTLKTIIRANPGLLLLKNGTIAGKWNWRDF